MENLPKTSIVIASYNNAPVLKKVLKAMLKIDYPSRYEIIVASDGCTDGTAEMMKQSFGGEKKIKYLDLPRGGVCKTRNAAIAATDKKSQIIINMDHDCIPEKNWLKDMVKGFENPQVGFVSAFTTYGGTSTGFRREALEKAGGGYDEDYFYYREDSDLAFKIMEAGFALKRVKAEYEHDHKMVKPKGLTALAKHVWQRINYHQNDVLLYKKHPDNEKVKEFLNIKHGFLVDPKSDFKAITGSWAGQKEFNISSPRGITFLENKSPWHALIIWGVALTYVLALKMVRLYGSFRFGKLLI
jgi:cellulose synthase/poly-beta-1,6-N-acetylglucosamine synthase-like glycosyltransferase